MWDGEKERKSGKYDLYTLNLKKVGKEKKRGEREEEEKEEWRMSKSRGIISEWNRKILTGREREKNSGGRRIGRERRGRRGIAEEGEGRDRKCVSCAMGPYLRPLTASFPIGEEKS